VTDLLERRLVFVTGKGGVGKTTMSAALAPRPLNDLERTLVGLAMARFQGAEPAQDAIPQNQADAYTLLKQLADGKFGK